MNAMINTYQTDDGRRCHEVFFGWSGARWLVRKWTWIKPLGWWEFPGVSLQVNQLNVEDVCCLLASEQYSIWLSMTQHWKPSPLHSNDEQRGFTWFPIQHVYITEYLTGKSRLSTHKHTQNLQVSCCWKLFERWGGCLESILFIDETLKFNQNRIKNLARMSEKLPCVKWNSLSVCDLANKLGPIQGAAEILATF